MKLHEEFNLFESLWDELESENLTEDTEYPKEPVPYKDRPEPPKTIEIVKLEHGARPPQGGETKWLHYDKITYKDPSRPKGTTIANIPEGAPGYGEWFGWGRHLLLPDVNYAAYDYNGKLLPNVDPEEPITKAMRDRVNAAQNKK